MITKNYITQVLVALLVFVVFATGATASEFAVQPGHSIGWIWLGATHHKIRKIMGRPYLIERDKAAFAESWRVGQSKDDYISAVFAQGRVVQIETNSPLFKTSHSISVRSNLSRIRKVLGNMKVISYGMNDPDPDIAEHAAHFYDSPKLGIAFELDLGARPDLAADVTPHSLIVHPANRQFHWFIGKPVWAADDER